MARHHKKHRRDRRRAPEQDPRPSALARLLLLKLFLAEQPLERRDLIKNIESSGYTNTESKQEIAQLVRRGLVESKGKSKLTLNRAAPFYTGTLVMKPAGFGFATELHPVGTSKTRLEDPFIPSAALVLGPPWGQNPDAG